ARDAERDRIGRAVEDAPRAGQKGPGAVTIIAAVESDIVLGDGDLLVEGVLRADEDPAVSRGVDGGRQGLEGMGLGAGAWGVGVCWVAADEDAAVVADQAGIIGGIAGAGGEDPAVAAGVVLLERGAECALDAANIEVTATGGPERHGRGEEACDR